MLEEKYQTLITHEINRILRELNKSSAIPDSEEVPGTRRKASISSNSAGGSPTTASQDFANELERAKREISMANERALEAEKKAELSEVRARLAEAKSRSSSVSGGALAAMAPRPHSMGSALIGDCVGVEHEPMQPIRAATPPAARSVMTSPVLKARDDNGAATASSLGALTVETKEPVVGVLAPATSASVMPTATPLKDYRDEQPIEDLVYDTAAANNRPTDKAVEWLERLKAQDVMTGMIYA